MDVWILLFCFWYVLEFVAVEKRNWFAKWHWKRRDNNKVWKSIFNAINLSTYVKLLKTQHWLYSSSYSWFMVVIIENQCWLRCFNTSLFYTLPLKAILAINFQNKIETKKHSVNSRFQNNLDKIFISNVNFENKFILCSLFMDFGFWLALQISTCSHRVNGLFKILLFNVNCKAIILSKRFVCFYFLLFHSLCIHTDTIHMCVYFK